MTKKFMLGAALSALMLSGAFAQMPKGPSPSSLPSAATRLEQAKPADQAKPAKSDQANPIDKNAASQPAGKQADVVMSQKPDQWLASNFKGTDVIGDDGKKVGDVSDILFDRNGKIEAYVISIGGFLGMGAKYVAIAPNSFTVVPGSKGKFDKLKLSMNKNELKQAQNFRPFQKPKSVTTGSATHSPLSGTSSLGGMHSPTQR